MALLQDLFENTTLRLRDSGMLSKIFVDELNASDVMPDPKVRVDQPLNIYQLATSFMVMAGGLTLGILAFLVECCFFTGKIKREGTCRRTCHPGTLPSLILSLEEVCNITCHILVTYILQFPTGSET